MDFLCMMCVCYRPVEEYAMSYSFYVKGEKRTEAVCYVCAEDFQ